MRLSKYVAISVILLLVIGCQQKGYTEDSATRAAGKPVVKELVNLARPADDARAAYGRGDWRSVDGYMVDGLRGIGSVNIRYFKGQKWLIVSVGWGDANFEAAKKYSYAYNRELLNQIEAGLRAATGPSP